MKRMLFAELNIPPINKTKTIQWFESLPEDYWFWDNYRQCYMLPLMSKSGKIKSTTSNNLKTKDFFWTEAVPDFIRDYFEKKVFNWTKMKGRIIVTRIMSHKEIPIHIDCSPQVFKTIQNKFRIVVQGKTNGLYFETRKGKVFAPDVAKPFIMDGAWPHAAINNSSLPRYTICFGSPWSQSDFYPGLNPLLYKDTKDLPDFYQEYFESSYKKKANESKRES